MQPAMLLCLHYVCRCQALCIGGGLADLPDGVTEHLVPPFVGEEKLYMLADHLLSAGVSFVVCSPHDKNPHAQAPNIGNGDLAAKHGGGWGLEGLIGKTGREEPSETCVPSVHKRVCSCVHDQCSVD
jgi:hypothetical protein